MRILIVHQYFLSKTDSGGSRWNQFAKYWADKGDKITVLAGTVHYASGKKEPEYKGKFVVREKESENIEVLRCYVSESYNKNFLGRLLAYISFTFSSIWVGLFCAGKYDVIICTSPPLTLGITGWILSKLKRVPMVFEVRDLLPESAIDTGVFTNKWVIKIGYWLEKKSYSSAKWINVLTPAFEEVLIEKKNIQPGKISMIPNGADIDIIKPGVRDNYVREKYGFGDKFVVTYVGAHGVANALMQLVKAAEILKEKSPSVQIVLVGAGMEKSALMQKAIESGLENITFIDSVPKSEIADYINASDVCTAVLKRCDTFKTVYPNKVFDYMSASKPIIIGIDGVARKLIEQAQSGIYVEPENAEEFAEAVLKLKEDPELCRKYGENGLEFVKQNFDRKVLAEKYRNILVNEVVRDKKKF